MGWSLPLVVARPCIPGYRRAGLVESCGGKSTKNRSLADKISRESDLKAPEIQWAQGLAQASVGAGLCVGIGVWDRLSRLPGSGSNPPLNFEW